MRKATLPATILAVGLIAASAIFGFFYKEARVVVSDQNKSISVKGYAEQNISSDKASWTGTLVTHAAALQEAYLQLEQQRPQLQQFLAATNLPEKEIVYSAVFTETHYAISPNGYPTNNITGYTLRQNATVESAQVDKVVALSTESSNLIRQGINFQSQQPQFFNSNIETLKLKMLGEAAKNARERAEQLAHHTGSKVGELTYASQGVFQITSVNSSEVSDYGTFDSFAREKTIKAVVTVSFTIE
ncbi:SIMPL domain-containing protein [Nafulsella turpanensis]|uniref:SIMPL domain-containing protein n=1 Tax=Nafulsella turpanensis TaxID=1265690 RepID=UPI00034DA087|nr:SIMPL domain-containing protein [Nafulsella turpanensis]